MTTRRFFYLLSRTLGDKQAYDRGRLGKRLLRRQVTRRLGRSYNKVWR